MRSGLIVLNYFHDGNHGSVIKLFSLHKKRLPPCGHHMLHMLDTVSLWCAREPPPAERHFLQTNFPSARSTHQRCGPPLQFTHRCAIIPSCSSKLSILPPAVSTTEDASFSTAVTPPDVCFPSSTSAVPRASAAGIFYDLSLHTYSVLDRPFLLLDAKKTSSSPPLYSRKAFSVPHEDPFNVTHLSHPSSFSIFFILFMCCSSFCSTPALVIWICLLHEREVTTLAACLHEDHEHHLYVHPNACLANLLA